MKKKEKRYQELSMPYRIAKWLKWMPIGYIKGLGWYFVKRLKWEDVCADDFGRISMRSCIGLCVGMAQSNMRWYYNWDEVFGDDGELRRKDREIGILEKLGNFIEEKFIEMIDGKREY